MEDVTIPGWATIVFGAIVLPWMVWQTLKTYANEKDTAVNIANVQMLATELTKINNSIDKLDAKLNTFLAKEIALLQTALNRDGS